MSQDLMPIVVVVGLLFIIIDIKTRLSPKAQLRIEVKERKEAGPIEDWSAVEESIPQGVTRD